MELEFETNFTIMPDQCNYHSPLVFGGALFSQMDLCAAVCTARLLRSSDTADSAVTHKADVTFHKPSYMGDIIFLKAVVKELRKKAIVLHVTAHKEDRTKPERIFIAEADFVFVAMRDAKEYVHHGLEMSK